MAAYSNGPQLDAGPLSTACSQGHRRLRILVLRFRLPCDIVMVTTTFCRHLKHYIKAATMPDTVPTRPGHSQPTLSWWNSPKAYASTRPASAMKWIASACLIDSHTTFAEFPT